MPKLGLSMSHGDLLQKFLHGDVAVSVKWPPHIWSIMMCPLDYDPAFQIRKSCRRQLSVI